MIIDTNLQFSLTQDLSGSGPFNSSNVVDLVKAGRDPGTGKILFLVVVVTLALTDSGSDSTVKVTLNGDPTASIAQTKTRDLFTIPALAAAGNTFIAPLHPQGDPETEEFLSLTYTVNNGNLTTGKVTSFLVQDVAAWKAYAKNYTIS